MMIAQKLYEWVDLWGWNREWLITYMRTDSVNLSDLARWDAKKVVEELYGKEFHNERNFKLNLQVLKKLMKLLDL